MTLNYEQRYFLDNFVDGDYSITPKGVVVIGNVLCFKKRLLTIPIKIHQVTGTFDCSCNYITTFNNFPKIIGGNFVCHDNSISDLRGGPQRVEGNYYCYNNDIKYLWGIGQVKQNIYNIYKNSRFDLTPDLNTAIAHASKYKVIGNITTLINVILEYKLYYLISYLGKYENKLPKFILALYNNGVL